LKNKYLDLLYTPLFKNNPIAVQVLGVCSALAVTTKMKTTVVMCLAVIFVLSFSNLFISIFRRYMPGNIRIIVEMIIIASLVIVADQVIKAYMFDISKELSVFVGLIITNCIIMGRAEAVAIHNPPAFSFFDGLGNGFGYSLILLVVGFVRELLGTGKVFGITMLKTVSEGGWYTTNGLFLLSPSAFFIIGIIVWYVRSMEPSILENR